MGLTIDQFPYNTNDRPFYNYPPMWSFTPPHSLWLMSLNIVTWFGGGHFDHGDYGDYGDYNK